MSNGVRNNGVRNCGHSTQITCATLNKHPATQLALPPKLGMP